MLCVCTTDSNHTLPIVPNLLARRFTTSAANTVWAGDMTYIPTREGWLYLAVVLDLAWYSRSPGKDCGLIFHSDRGSQYASRCYTDLLVEHGIRASVSRKGNCWDNACLETLFGSLMVERLHGMELQSHRQAKDVTLDWLLW